MGAGFYAQLRKILTSHGCKLVRQGKGSHEIWYSPLSSRNFTVAVTVKYRSTANAILSEAGIDKKV